jgi:hypothetical protein
LLTAVKEQNGLEKRTTAGGDAQFEPPLTSYPSQLRGIKKLTVNEVK